MEDQRSCHGKILSQRVNFIRTLIDGAGAGQLNDVQPGIITPTQRDTFA